MPFNGVKRIRLLFICACLITSLRAENANQFLGGQKLDYQELESIEKSDSPFVPGTLKKEESEISSFENEDSSGSHVPGVSHKEGEYKENAADFGLKPPFQDSPNLLTTNNRDIFKSVYRQGSWGLSFSYLKDEYEVSDPSGIFNKTYVNNTEGNRYGSLMLGLDRYFFRGFFDFSYGMNAGVGMNRGLGIFSTSQETSETHFTLWTIPLDIKLTMEIPVGRLFSLALTGGPSLMGLYQSRDDKKSGESNKHRRQLSPGYFGEGKLKISLGNIFSGSAFNLFSDYKITNYYLNVMARYHSYSNFQDDISMSGSSFGAGFTFDYL